MCNRPSNVPDAPSRSTQASAHHQVDTSWQPKWDVAPDKGKKEKPALSPIVSFADEGFHGSPIPENEIDKREETKNREAFVESFQREPQCFGFASQV